jgi:hypothetical protein
MHSYLIISQNQGSIQNEIDHLITGKKLKPYPFQIRSISDVRGLNILLKLNIAKPTGVIIKEIDQVTDEAANAFLKNLEEPQQNVTFILSASSIYQTPPTIVSRCQTINLNTSHKIRSTNMLTKFLSLSTSDKLRHISTIRDRTDALSFVKELIYQSHTAIHFSKPRYKRASLFIKYSQSTHNALKANGNVNLQLTNFIMSLE